MRLSLPLVIFAGLQAADMATTAYAMSRGGIEANPFAAFILSHLGMSGLASLKVAVVAYAAVVGGVCERRGGRRVWDFVIRAGGVVYALVVVSNLVVGGLI